MSTPSIRQPRIGPRSCDKKAKARGRFSPRISLLPSRLSREAMLPMSSFANVAAASPRDPSYMTYKTHSRNPILLSQLFCGLLLLLVVDSSAREPISPPPKLETQTKTIRARDLGILFEGIPGKFNAITDVPGVEVGYTTLISGEGKLEVGKGPVRTGVTAILPRGREDMNDPVFAGYFSLNGNGEMTGTASVEESGLLSGAAAAAPQEMLRLPRWHSHRFPRSSRDRVARPHFYYPHSRPSHQLPASAADL